MISFDFGLGVSILSFILFFWLQRLYEVRQNQRWVPTLDPDAPVNLPDDPPLISVLVPAHNEEHAIEQCLQSIIDQDYPNLEIICVDDRSTDNTADLVARKFRGKNNCRLISIDQRLEGWTGKCHALHVASRFARGSWLAFLDADSSLHTRALKQCLNEALKRKINFITLTPKFLLGSFWEKAIQPTLASMAPILFPLDQVNDPKSPVATANGMFFMVSRKAYDQIGGHENVRDLAVEDIGIGKRIKAAGLGLLFANGRKLLFTRMYSGFEEVIKGWTRILSAAMNYRLSTALKYLPMHILVSLPCFLLAMNLYLSAAPQIMPVFWVVLPLACALAMTLASIGYFDLMGLPRHYSLYLSIGNLTLIVVHVIIVKKIFCKDALQWRGETYNTTRYQPKFLDPPSQEMWNKQSSKKFSDSFTSL